MSTIKDERAVDQVHHGHESIAVGATGHAVYQPDAALINQRTNTPRRDAEHPRSGRQGDEAAGERGRGPEPPCERLTVLADLADAFERSRHRPLRGACCMPGHCCISRFISSANRAN